MTTAKYARGYVRARNHEHLKQLSPPPGTRGGWRASPRATEPAWDSRTLGVVPPVQDQGQCGSCWDFAGTCVVEVALAAAGNPLVKLSEEYTLSCGRNGGCGGDDLVNVLEWAKATGIPAAADYGPYTAAPGACNYRPGMKLYRLADWGYVPGVSFAGPTPTQNVKDAIKAYRCVAVAVAAGDDWDAYAAGKTLTGSNTGINHAVVLVGWDDAHDNGDGTRGAWLVRNQWGTGWGDAGYAWAKYGADQIGTEAAFGVAAAPPAPVPPSPPPPPPPTPMNQLHWCDCWYSDGMVHWQNADRTVQFSRTPFPGFGGPVNVATDGVYVACGAGAGGSPRVTVYDALTGAQISSFFAFDPSFRGGVNVAVAANFVRAGAAPGGGPMIADFSPQGRLLGADYRGNPAIDAMLAWLRAHLVDRVTPKVVTPPPTVVPPSSDVLSEVERLVALLRAGQPTPPPKQQ